MQAIETDIDRDIMEVYYSEVRRPGYVLQLGGRQQLAKAEARPLTATIRERDTNRHAVVEHRRPRH
jgi:hypothetical protein